MNNFEKERIKEHIMDFAKIHLTKAKKSRGNNAFACLFCDSGTGNTGTSAMSIKDKTFNCLKCGEHGDIFCLGAKVYGLDIRFNFPEICEKVQKDLDTVIGSSIPEINLRNCLPTRSLQDQKVTSSSKEPEKDYSQYINESILHLRESSKAMEYLYNRGFTDETIKKFRLGYDFAKKTIITPYNSISMYYIARSIESKQFYKPKFLEAGPEPLFNKEALYSGECVFVTEGAFDTISFEQLGYRSVAIGGTGYEKLIKVLLEMEEKPKLILALDNDQGGRDATRKLEEALQAHSIDFATLIYPEGVKDANEALNRDSEAFKKMINESEQFFENHMKEEKARFIKQSNLYYCKEFLKDTQSGKVKASIPTGFEKLDEVFDGGLQEGLYIVGAISSLGKTTLVTQIADQIAQQKKKVLFFSLEMARTELITRSISRHTFQIYDSNKNCYKLSNAKTSKSVRNWKLYDQNDQKLMRDSVEQYLTYASNFFVFEGVGDIGVTKIREIVHNYSKILEETPVVFIDYLQLLAPYNDRSTDKQNTDKAVLELKRISRDFKSPVIAVSSLNRQSYSSKMSMESFKESGAIEYSSDVLIGLQFYGVGSDKFDVNEAKSKEPREIELTVLKNRNGKSGDTIKYNYHAMFNCFVEV